MKNVLQEVWVWLSRTQDGQLHPQLKESLHESGALARRLGIPLVGVSNQLPSASEHEALGPWALSGIRTLDGAQSPHPQILRGQSPLAALGTCPRAMVLLADVFGSVVAPLFSEESGASLVTAATSITCNAEAYVVARPTLGGQFEALVTIPFDHQVIVTLRPGSVGDTTPPVSQRAVTGALPLLGPHVAAGNRREPHTILEPQPDTLAVSDADRIVAFGRGAFSRDAVALVERLAKQLQATVAGTRPAADEGWLPFAKQVGLTGAIVSPKLYVAIGISGAPYHMVGVKDPETLIAINSDPEAPIFASAHLGIVGDLRTVLPELISRLEGGAPIPEAVASLRSTRVS